MNFSHKKYFFWYLLLSLIVSTITLLAFPFIAPSTWQIVTFNFILLTSVVGSLLYYSDKRIQQLEEKSKEESSKIESEYEQAIKNIYDEHIFSITHELRSPLSVIAATSLSIFNNLKNIYSRLTKQIDNDDISKQNVSNIKKYVKTIKEQIDIIQSFITSVSEHGSYVKNKSDGEKLVSLHQYLISIILNSFSYSRTMRIFKNNVIFGDGFGRDFENINAVVNPQDLSRMLMNIMTNAADAVESCYKQKKLDNAYYEPQLKLRCIKSHHLNSNVVLKNDYICIVDNEDSCYSLYLVIEDNGPGISRENMKKIFEYGFSTKDDYHFGIGLHLTIQLAKKNNLGIFLKTDDHGTKFVIGFPKTFISEQSNKVLFSDDSDKLYEEAVENDVMCDDKMNEDILVFFKKETDTKMGIRFKEDENN
jgi:signal transduction histidine kinase